MTLSVFPLVLWICCRPRRLIVILYLQRNIERLKAARSAADRSAAP